MKKVPPVFSDSIIVIYYLQGVSTPKLTTSCFFDRRYSHSSLFRALGDTAENTMRFRWWYCTGGYSLSAMTVRAADEEWWQPSPGVNWDVSHLVIAARVAKVYL